MAFGREADVTKDSIQDISINLFVPGPANTEGVQSGTIDVQIGLSNGKFEHQTYNLLDRLNDDPIGQAHLANLIALKTYVVTRLNNEVLPV